MKPFINDDFLLQSETAKELYHQFASPLPIIDYHCHINPREIAQDCRFENISRLWFTGDHYKWRLMRAAGVAEEVITGKGAAKAACGDYEKFTAFARVLPKAAGNPVYHWTHLELKRFFDCDLILSPATADEIWRHCNKKINDDNLSVRGLIKKARVKLIATTDDPADSLEWHKIIADDKSFKTKVLPAFRPDKALNIEKPGFKEYLEALGKSAGILIKNYDDLLSALAARIDFFASMGCLISDHGLDYIPYENNAEATAPEIFSKAMNGETITVTETQQYKTALLLFLGYQYVKHNWVMQYHCNVMRNVNTSMYKKLGADTGNDAINSSDCGVKLASLLDLLNQNDALPKTILYSLNPNDDAMLITLAGCFPAQGIAAKVQHGSAWWFNDTKASIEAQLSNLAARGLLGGFIGMLTDSRSFLSYPRHEYFRRLLCNTLGRWVEDGEYPSVPNTLGEIVKDISYYNAVRYFGFNLEK